MWLRMLARWEIGRMPEVLGLLRSHPGQGSRSRSAHADEERRMYLEAFEQLGADRPFTSDGSAMSSAESDARSLVWLGDSMAFHRHWFEFSNQQYRQALSRWPSWRNPARLRLLLGARALTAPDRWLRLWRHRLGAARQAISGGMVRP